MSKSQAIKVCFFSKYPPIEGGVSSRTYWLSRALAERGVEVHIVTNALEVEEEYRETFDLEEPSDRKEYEPKNVFVHSLNLNQNTSGVPFHIPFSPAYLERLISLGIRVIEKYGCNLIDSHYLQPYGVAAAFTKLLTSKPCILRNAGSDISRLFPKEDFHDLYQASFKVADIIITQIKNKDVFGDSSISQNKLWASPFHSIPPQYFNPKVKPANLADFGIPPKLLKKPILTYMGKCTLYKCLFDLVKVASQIKEDFLLFFVTKGSKLEEFKAYLKRFPSLKNKYYFLDFLPPWRIPSVLRASTCLLQLETGFPVKGHKPIQPIEAFATAIPVLISQELFQKYKNIYSPNLKKDGNVLSVNPRDHFDLKNVLLKIIRNPRKIKQIGRQGHRELFDEKEFEKGVEDRVSLYRKMLGGQLSP
jgi:glycosyltransferase involved in cell wall biosynthesis